MADIELVIKIPKEMYNTACNYPEMVLAGYSQCIRNGTPLPKGHGRIVDETKISKCKQVGVIIKDGNITRCFTVDAPTIIPAADKR